jgi:Leucine-rich repeat (LRR) protein
MHSSFRNPSLTDALRLQFVLPTAHNNMQGSLPSELNHLQSMEHFSVFGNSLTGSLPDLGQWQNLDFFNVDSNSFTGSIGSWFNFPMLEYLDLASNDFSGTLPSFDGATSLLEAALQNNRFEGSVDAFNGATSLSILYLQNNNLNGALSSDTLADITLRQFDASNNRITGSFPAHFYKFHAIDMHNNSLSGELPPVTTAGGPLYFLSLYGNQIEGSLPDTLGMLYNLIHLDLSNNQLTGTLMMDIFDQLQQLEYLFLHNNNFDSGNIMNMWKLTNLKELSLKGTNRVGPIPSWIGKYLTNLVLLDLHQNQLTGTIPTTFGSMTGLRFLFLNDNRLSGTIPSELANMDGLCTCTAYA